MKIRFLGAVDGHVTGSCTHFYFERTNVQFLVDCGLKQGEGPYGLSNDTPFPFDASEISFVLLTHAHQDHCGLLPKLYRDGFTGDVICTSSTAALTLANLRDSQKHVGDLFSAEDIKKLKFNLLEDRPKFGLSRMMPIHDHLFISVTRSAHILGSCSITISWNERDNERRSLVMSGDLGNNTKDNPYQSLLAGRQGIFGYPDYLVIESTYGSRVREERFSSFDQKMSDLFIATNNTAMNNGILVAPAFSMHRTQELLVDLFTLFNSEEKYKFEKGLDIIIDSKLACAVTRIYQRELNRRQAHKPDETLYRNRRLAERFNVNSEDEVENILTTLFDTSRNSDNPIIIGKHTITYQVGFSINSIGEKLGKRGTILLTGGGMCEGGPVVEHLKFCLTNQNFQTNLLITGYMAPDSLGDQLVRTINSSSAANNQDKYIELEDIKIPLTEIRTGIIDLRGYYSGHADQQGLLDFIFNVAGSGPSSSAKPISVFINHGQHAARKSLESAILSRELSDHQRQVKEVLLPDNDAWFDLDAGTWSTQEEISGVERQLLTLISEQRKTNSLLKQLIDLQTFKNSRPSKKS